MNWTKFQNTANVRQGRTYILVYPFASGLLASSLKVVVVQRAGLHMSILGHNVRSRAIHRFPLFTMSFTGVLS